MSSNAVSHHRQLRRPAYQDPVWPSSTATVFFLIITAVGHLLRQPCSSGVIRPGATGRWFLTPREESYDARPLRSVPA